MIDYTSSNLINTDFNDAGNDLRGGFRFKAFDT